MARASVGTRRPGPAPQPMGLIFAPHSLQLPEPVPNPVQGKRHVTLEFFPNFFFQVLDPQPLPKPGPG